MVWAGSRKGDLQILYKTYDEVSGNWATEKTLPATVEPIGPICTDEHPSIMQAKNGTIFIAWQSNRLTTSDWKDAIFYSISKNNGVSWSSAIALTSNLEFNRAPHLLQLANGTIWLVWSKYHGSGPLGNYDIFYRTCNGAAWSSERQLTTDLRDDDDPAITQTLDGRIWLVWSKSDVADPSLFSIYCQTYANNAWSDATELTDGGYIARNAAIYQMIYGTIWIIYQRETESSDTNLWYMTSSNGTDWTAPAEPENVNSVYDEQSPAIFQARNRAVWLTWASDQFDHEPPMDGQWEIVYQTSQVFPGDVNGDDQVYTLDLALIGYSYGQMHGSPIFNPAADLNNDGEVWAEDLAIVGRNFGLGTSPPPP